MSNDQPPKRKMSKWIKYPLVTLGVLVVLSYVYWQTVARALHEEFSNSESELMAIALGTHNHLNVEWDRPGPLPNANEPACTAYLRKYDSVRHDAVFSDCIEPYQWVWGPGCGWWRFETCEIYAVDDFILTQPEYLGRILHALKDPCAYLPTKEQINLAWEKRRSNPDNMHILFRWYSCGSGRGFVPRKVILNVRNDDGDVIAQYIQYPPKG